MRNYTHAIEKALSSVSRPRIPEGAGTRPGRLKAKGVVICESVPYLENDALLLQQTYRGLT